MTVNSFGNRHVLIKDKQIHYDAEGRSRTIITVYLYDEGRCVSYIAYTDQQSYKVWLLDVLNKISKRMSELRKTEKLVIRECTIYKSFYSIAFSIASGWRVLPIVPLAGNKLWGLHTSNYAASLEDAINHIRTLPDSWDFEIINRDTNEYEVFPMNDESFLIAILKYSDIK